MNHSIQALLLGLKDALTPRNLRYFFYATGIVLVLMALLYLLLNGVVNRWLVGGEEGVLSWLVNMGTNALLGVLGYLLFTPLVLMVVSLFSEQIFNGIRASRYSVLGARSGLGLRATLKLMATTFIKYAAGLLLLSPLLLVGVGYIVYLVVGFLLFRKLLLLDVVGVRHTLDEVQQQSVLGREGRYRLSTLLLYLLSMIPLLNLFVPYLALCVIANESMRLEVDAHHV